MSTHDEAPHAVPSRDIDWSIRPGAGWLEFQAARDAYRGHLGADAELARLERAWVEPLPPEIGRRCRNATRLPLSARRGGSL
jgi:hypothetical protein